MRCAQFEMLLRDLDRAGTEAFAIREIALAHAESCGRCASLLTQSESLDMALRAISREEAGQQAPARIEALLLDEFRQRNAASSLRRLPWRRVAALATAAAVCLALGLSLYRRSGQTQNAKRIPTNSSAPGLVGRTAGSAASANEDQDLIAENQWSASESETDFLPLPYADGTAAGEGGAIVRVTLSRSALASLGLPVTDMSATDRIPADILVSEDGAPQAIRLVAQSELDEQ